jgi:hypothetical protein
MVTLSPRRVFSRHPAPCSARHRLGLRIREHRLDQLEIADPAAELLALAGIGDAFADQPLGHADADGRDVQPPAIEHLHGHLEALAFRAEPQLLGTRAFSKITSQICAPCWPIFFSGLPMVMPGVFAGTMNAEMPAAPFFDGSLRAAIT